MQLTDEKYAVLKELLESAWDAEKQQFTGKSPEHHQLMAELMANAPEIIADLAEQHRKPTVA